MQGGGGENVGTVAAVLHAGRRLCLLCIMAKANLTEERATDALRHMSRALRLERSVALCAGCQERRELFELR
jgi:hypothetical protein